MSIEGQLTIKLHYREGKLRCELSSSRPLYASRLFTGKPIDSVLQTLPMLFNICGKAQTVAALRASESYLEQTTSIEVEQQREALVWLESLREQLWRILLDWSKDLDKVANSQLISSITQNINALSQDINHNQTLLTRSPIVNTIKQHQHWNDLRHLLETSLLGATSEQWLSQQFNIERWASKKQTLAACYIDWLQQQTWRHVGSSSIKALNNWDNTELQQRLNDDEYTFSHKPDWKGQPKDVSWFSSQLHHPLMARLLKENGNGLYPRVIARLVGTADLIKKLDDFFNGTVQVDSNKSSNGMAHINAARGRLTHTIQLEGKMVKQLNILAPTEWNFHPEGVAAKGLENLQGTNTEELEQQAHSLIHAIDPCVGYKLSVTIS